LDTYMHPKNPHYIFAEKGHSIPLNLFPGNKKTFDAVGVSNADLQRI